MLKLGSTRDEKLIPTLNAFIDGVLRAAPEAAVAVDQEGRVSLHLLVKHSNAWLMLHAVRIQTSAAPAACAIADHRGMLPPIHYAIQNEHNSEIVGDLS